MKRLFALLVCCAAPVGAQLNPFPSVSDLRIAEVKPGLSQVVRLGVAPGGSLDLLFPVDQRIEAVTLGSNRDFKVVVSGRADRLMISATRASEATTMTVRTDRRLFEFVLSSAGQAQAFYLVKVQDDVPAVSARPAPAPIEPTFPESGRYRISGSKDIRPIAMHDDGLRTYIKWGNSQALPAVFALDRAGHEEMVNGHMRDGIFTIDRVHLNLVFRIDKIEARAVRRKEAKARHGG